MEEILSRLSSLKNEIAISILAAPDEVEGVEGVGD